MRKRDLGGGIVITDLGPHPTDKDEIGRPKHRVLMPNGEEVLCNEDYLNDAKTVEDTK